jgi:hypothetical protein
MNFELFLETLPIMAKGMLGIFIVTGAILASMVLLNKIPSKNGDA